MRGLFSFAVLQLLHVTQVAAKYVFHAQELLRLTVLEESIVQGDTKQVDWEVTDTAPDVDNDPSYRISFKLIHNSDRGWGPNTRVVSQSENDIRKGDRRGTFTMSFPEAGSFYITASSPRNPLEILGKSRNLQVAPSRSQFMPDGTNIMALTSELNTALTQTLTMATTRTVPRPIFDTRTPLHEQHSLSTQRSDSRLSATISLGGVSGASSPAAAETGKPSDLTTQHTQGSNAGAIAGGVIGGLAFVALLAFLVTRKFRQRERRMREMFSQELMVQTPEVIREDRPTYDDKKVVREDHPTYGDKKRWLDQ